MPIDAPIGFALAAGMVAAFNPCGFAMLPAYLSYFVSGDLTAGSSRGTAVLRALVVTAAMTAGFMVVFGAAGLAIESASLAVGRWTPWVTLTIGILLVPLGVALMVGRQIKVRLPRLQRGGDRRLLGMGLFGASYATVSLSCTLPVFLTAVTGSFRTGDLAGGLATYLAYATGMGLVVGVITLAVALAQDGMVRRLRGVLAHINRVSGVLLVVTGAYVAYYGYFEIRTLAGDDVAAGPVDWVTGWSAGATEKVDGAGAALFAIALVLLTAVGLTARTIRGRRPPASEMQDSPHRADVSTSGVDR
ncbi:MAG: cytochrome c biogenesis CcdA family protein [Acidimicrobiales bacterium]